MPRVLNVFCISEWRSSFVTGFLEVKDLKYLKRRN